LITIHGELFSAKEIEFAISRDPDDDKFIATALASNCNIIISGDKDLLDLNGYADIHIINPSTFIREYLKKH
jgi:predicted nucleic acid-binding protein